MTDEDGARSLSVAQDRATRADGPSGGGADAAWSPWPAIMLATLVGTIARAAPIVAAGFPVNDGGLFASMVDSVLTRPQLLPNTVTYNGLGAPFAYPPLAFLVTAGLERLIPIGTVEWLRWIPLVASIATVPAFALLALEISPTRVHAAVATFAFALVPASFEWLVMGGGLTRAPGLLFSLLAIWCAFRFLNRGGRAWIGAGIALGMTELTHPEAGLFAAVSLTLAALAYARGRYQWSRMLGAAAIGVAITAPWLLVVVGRNGAAPLLSAASTGADLLRSVLYLLTMRLTSEPLWMLAAGLAALGFIYALYRRRFFLPVWLTVVVLIDQRGADTYTSAPVSVLAAIGLLDVIVARLANVRGDLAESPGWPGLLRGPGVSILLAGTLVLGMVSAFRSPFLLSPMSTLSPDAREAMAWVRSSIPRSAHVAVVTGRSWYEDATSEWFPYLADRQSVATLQGYEWMGAAAWTHQLDVNESLQRHSTDAIGTLDEWARQAGVDFDYVYLPKGPLGVLIGSECCSAMRETVRTSSDYQVVHDGVGATIAVRRRS